MHTLAPESATNSLPSCFIVDAAGKLHSSVGEKNVALSFSLRLYMFLARFHALPRAHRCCLSVSSCPQISQRGYFADEAFRVVFFQAMVLHFPGYLLDVAQTW